MGKLNIYYQDTIEDQPLDSSSVTVIEKTGSTSTKVTTDSGERGVKLSVPSSIRPRPVPVPVVAKELISDSLNTQSRQIISTYTFGKTGALQVGEYVNGTSGDLRITPDGITARNSSGTTTFSIDGTTGNATFLGTVAAGSVISTTISANNITGTIVDAQIATISWAKITDVAIENADIVNLSADKITSGSLDGIEMTIGNDNDVFKASSSGIHLGNASFASAPFRVDMDGNLVATSVTVTGAVTTQAGSNLNLDYVTAGTLTAGSITGITITGGTIRTASSGARIVMDDGNELEFYDNNGVLQAKISPIGVLGAVYASGNWEFPDTIQMDDATIILAGISLLTIDTGLSMNSANIDMNGNDINELDEIGWNTRSSDSSKSWALYMYNNSGYSLRTRMNSSTWTVDQSSA